VAWKYGTAGADRFYGSKAANGIDDAPDWYDGLGGNDIILAGGGWIDEIRGGSGNDYIDLQAGNGKAWGGTGDDKLFANGGDSVTLYGDAGNDIVDGRGAYWETLYGGDGNDRIYTGGGTGYAYADAGNDVVVWAATGGYDESILKGGAGTDTLHLENHARVYSQPGNFDSPKVDPVAWFVMNKTAVGGMMHYTQSLDAPPTNDNEQGRFDGFETIYNGAASTATISYIGGFSNMTVTGGTKNDRFESGKGNEVFNGVGGRDAFVFDFSKGNLGVDDINGFTKGVDSIVSLNDDRLTFKQVVSNGHTMVTATDASGHQVLSLDIDTTGLPAFSTMDHWNV
jgi:Ca2+-binding RTX toxin-like protein